MPQKFYPGLGLLPETLETRPPGLPSRGLREEGLRGLREELTSRPVEGVLGPIARLALGLPMYSDPQDKMNAQLEMMDRISQVQPSGEWRKWRPVEERIAERMYGQLPSVLGPSASGEAVAVPSDRAMGMSVISGGAGRIPGWFLGMGPSRGQMPFVATEDMGDEPTAESMFPEYTGTGMRRMPPPAIPMMPNIWYPPPEPPQDLMTMMPWIVY
jgi:hypothetical protein